MSFMLEILISIINHKSRVIFTFLKTLIYMTPLLGSQNNGNHIYSIAGLQN